MSPSAQLAATELYLRRNLWSFVTARSRQESGGKVTQFDDYVVTVGDGAVQPNAKSVNASHAFVQADTTYQVPAITTSANTANRECAVFTNHIYVSNLTAADWAFTADGTGFDSLTVYRVTSAAGIRVFWQTSSASTDRGIALYFNGAQARRAVFRTGVAAAIADAQFGTIASGTFYATQFTHSSAGSPQHAARMSGQALASGSYTNAPDSGAVQVPFSIGGNTGPAFPASVDLCDVMIANRVDAGLQAAMQRYARLRYGLVL